MARIVIGSYLFRFPLGGYMSWVLQWLLGFQRLGHDVYVVERSGYPNSCYDPASRHHSDDCSYGVQTVGAWLNALGFSDRWCYHDRHDAWHGLSRTAVADVFRTADLFIDMGAHGAWQDEAAHVGCSALIDGEPGRTQIRRERLLAAGQAPPQYDFYFTVGRNVGTSRGLAPTNGVTWRPAFDPVHLDLFPVEPAPPGAPFTTVMSWRAHETLEYDGVAYGQKDRSFAQFMDLPARVRAPLEIAVSGPETPERDLVAAGWRVRDAEAVTVSFDSWREYIRMSRGEFGVCKEIFVGMRTASFSDRSAVYLASGRPVVAQDTGFSQHLPCGEGLFAVRTAEEAADALERIIADPGRHQRAARAIAEAHLSTSVVCPAFLAEVGL